MIDGETREEATYEQCPYDLAHVEAIYMNLKGIINADGDWHPFPERPGGIGQYRVFNDQHFQAVFARSDHALFTSLLDMDPVDSDDDAEWTVWRLGEEGYGLTSSFAVTPGPFGHEDEVRQWLDRHALDLVPHLYHIQGVAYFSDIEAGCMLDAMMRLNWLEHIFRELNEEYIQLSRNFWEIIREQSDRIRAEVPEVTAEDEILPLPPLPPRISPKRRKPIE